MRALVLLVSLAHLLPACRKEASHHAPIGDVAMAPSQLNIAMREPGSIDPAFLDSSNDFQIAANVYQGLYRFNPHQGRAEPALVKFHRTDSEHRIWFFKLVADARYANGRPIQADDFRFAWQRILTPATASSGADALYILRDGQRMASGETVPFSVTVIAPDELRVELETPQPFLPEMLASPRFAPLPEDAFQDPTKDLFVQGLELASGPYRVASWKARESMVLEPNPHFSFPKGHPPFHSVNLRFSSSEETALAWWDGGEVDLVQGLVPFQKILQLKGKYPGALVSQPMHSVFYLFIAHTSPALADTNVRRALLSAIDRDGLVTDVLGGGQLPALAFVPPTYASATGFDPAPCKTLDHAAANRAIAPAKVSLQGAEMTCNASQSLRTIMEYVQQSFQRELGLFIAIRMIEWGTFLEDLKKGKFQLARMSLSGGPDPIDFLDNFTSHSPNNFGRFFDPEYDQIVAAAHLSGDGEERAGMMQRAHAILCQKLPALPVYFSSQIYLVREPLRDRFSPSPEGIILYQTLR